MVDLYVILLGAGFSFLLYCSGVGAGVVVVPCLIFLLNLEPLQAVATGSFFSVIAKVAMSSGHFIGGNIRVNCLLRYLLFASPLALIVSILIGFLGVSSSNQINYITRWVLFGAGMVGLLTLLWKSFGQWVARFGMPSIASITGALVGSTGVGGGVLVVPTLLNVAQIGIKEAVATSIPIGLVLSALVSIGLGSQGFIQWDKVISLSVGAIVALPVIIPLFKIIPEKLIRRLVILLIGVTLLVLLQGLLLL